MGLFVLIIDDPGSELLVDKGVDEKKSGPGNKSVAGINES